MIVCLITASTSSGTGTLPLIRFGLGAHVQSDHNADRSARLSEGAPALRIRKIAENLQRRVFGRNGWVRHWVSPMTDEGMLAPAGSAGWL